ncbi:stage II sporulation protein M [Candidatus Woesearchaeota archaeon]|nr:stage II sporulation protein M [Candidatus Woesearchaeota archaeon]
MVLEVLINPKRATGKPWEMFFIGAIYSLVGLVLGYWVFRSYVSIIMVSFTALAAAPFVYNATKAEDDSTSATKESTLLKKHAPIIKVFTFLFLGFVAVFLLAFIVLPEPMAGEIFKTQIESIAAVRNEVTGNFTSIFSTMGIILANNLKVLVLCVIFSLIYGMGAIFILSWNASVMSAAIGDAIREGLQGTGSSLVVISSSLAGYFVHGLPEIVAYFIAGLGGGILSVALMKYGVHSRSFRKAGVDCVSMVTFAVLMLVLAATIEVFVSPTLL